MSDSLLRRLGIAFSVIGLLVALYLIYIKYNPTSALCLASGGCEVVNTSIYSAIRGVPVAALGAFGYLIILSALLLETRNDWVGEWGSLVVFGIALIGTLYSAYLTYIEVAVLHKICPYCVTSAVMMTLLLVISSIRLRRYLA
ncbi:MAG TPA: vitamin K epoxide reductase family protein [Pseudomonadales bacterium]|nr:vitamin K epoxide reductase family protein [Pseudomonadales bacterium]